MRQKNSATTDEILADVLRVYRLTKSSRASVYARHGKFTANLVRYRAGGWNAALKKLKLPIWKPKVRTEVDDWQPIWKPKIRHCLKCDVVFESVHFTCDKCRTANTAMSLAVGCEGMI